MACLVQLITKSYTYEIRRGEDEDKKDDLSHQKDDQHDRVLKQACNT